MINCALVELKEILLIKSKFYFLSDEVFLYILCHSRISMLMELKMKMKNKFSRKQKVRKMQRKVLNEKSLLGNFFSSFLFNFSFLFLVKLIIEKEKNYF